MEIHLLFIPLLKKKNLFVCLYVSFVDTLTFEGVCGSIARKIVLPYIKCTRVKKRVSERVLWRPMHIIRSETFRARQESPHSLGSDYTRMHARKKKYGRCSDTKTNNTQDTIRTILIYLMQPYDTSNSYILFSTAVLSPV